MAYYLVERNLPSCNVAPRLLQELEDYVLRVARDAGVDEAKFRNTTTFVSNTRQRRKN